MRYGSRRGWLEAHAGARMEVLPVTVRSVGRFIGGPWRTPDSFRGDDVTGTELQNFSPCRENKCGWGKRLKMELHVKLVQLRKREVHSKKIMYAFT